MNLQPIKRCINHQEYLEWINMHSAQRAHYDDFIAEMTEKDYKKEKIDDIWLQNIGAIPPSEPDRFYHCNIICEGISITLTLRRFVNNSDCKFKVIKINRIFLNGQDRQTSFSISSGKMIRNKEYKKTFKKNTGYSINYLNDDWFNSYAIEDLLSKFKLVVKNDKYSNDGVIITNFEFMESVTVEIIDKDFEKELFLYIERKFEKIDSELR